MYTRCLYRLFTRKRAPVFVSSHVRNLDKRPTALGLPRSDKYYDPDRMNKLHKLVKDGFDAKGLSLSNSVKRLAREDQEFNNFLKEFKSETEPQWSSILECKDINEFQTFKQDLQKTDEERLAELHFLDQFRKRNIAKKLNTVLDLKKPVKPKKDAHKKYSESNEEEGDDKDEFIAEERAAQAGPDEEEREEKISSTEQLNFGLTKNQDQQEEEDEESQNNINNYFNIKGLRGIGLRDIIKLNPQEFFIHFLDASSTTNVTKLFRVNSRRVLLYMGNGDGIIGYGMGKGADYREAFDKAVTNCKKNLIVLQLDHLVDCPGHLHGKYHDITVDLWPSLGGQYKCKPEFANLTLLAGLGNCKIRVHGANRNIYAIVYAFFNAVRNNTTPKGIAEKMGEKVYQIGFESVHKVHKILPTR